MEFEPDSIKEAVDYYKKLRFASDQKDIIIEFGKLMKKFIPLSDRAIMGFIWRSLKEWQLNFKRDLSELSKLDPGNRIEAVVQIIDIFGIRLKKVLINKEQEPILEQAMQNALERYKENYANR